MLGYTNGTALLERIETTGDTPGGVQRISFGRFAAVCKRDLFIPPQGTVAVGSANPTCAVRTGTASDHGAGMDAMD